MVTNGLNHYFCKMDFENENISFLLNFQLYPLNKQNENSILNWNGVTLLEQFYPQYLAFRLKQLYMLPTTLPQMIP
jgi:hypothetical protein